MATVGILGTGIVGRTLAETIAGLGHHVLMGTRDPNVSRMRAEPDERGNEGLGPWLDRMMDVRLETLPAAASGAQIVFNAISGEATLEGLSEAGEGNLAGKVLVDISNPLDFSQGFPPSLTVPSTDSLAEHVQRTFPETRVVKALNMVTAPVMVNPGALGNGDHDTFIAGDDQGAKDEVSAILTDWFGWRSVVDLGDLTAARGMEAYLLLWVRLMMVQQTVMFNIKIMR